MPRFTVSYNDFQITCEDPADLKIAVQTLSEHAVQNYDFRVKISGVPGQQAAEWWQAVQDIPGAEDLSAPGPDAATPRPALPVNWSNYYRSVRGNSNSGRVRDSLLAIDDPVSTSVLAQTANLTGPRSVAMSVARLNRTAAEFQIERVVLRSGDRYSLDPQARTYLQEAARKFGAALPPQTAPTRRAKKS
jgi:hypothetical protein